MKKGDLVRINVHETLFWEPDYFVDHHITPIHNIDKEMLENPIALFIGYDFTENYCKILWNNKIGWVNTKAIELI